MTATAKLKITKAAVPEPEPKDFCTTGQAPPLGHDYMASGRVTRKVEPRPSAV